MENSMEVPKYRTTNDTAIPFLGIYLDKTFFEKDTRNSMFITALFTIAKTWKQPQCPLTDDGIKKMWYIYTMEYYLTTKKNKIMPFAAIDGTRDFHTKDVSQKEKDKNK
uniref:Uncharacterized protein n=1 Tax=Sus scrofa TaxID=9823 RepID=A0A8D0S367_PIG